MTMKKKNYKFETLQVRAGQEIDPVSKGTAVPIYQSTAYTFDSMEYGAELFELKRPGNIYTRITNTTNEVFEKRMAALEGGVAAVSTASGQSAVFLSITNICGPGDNIVAQPFLYGGTFTMFAITLRDMGIEVRMAKSDSAADLEALVDSRTKALFLENIGNPAFNIPDYEPIVEMARRKGICVMVDNTFGMGGYLFRPFEWGAHVSVHSATKWIGGHGIALGGVVVDGGNFDWTPEKYPLLAAPSESYHGLVYKDVFGPAAFAISLMSYDMSYGIINVLLYALSCVVGALSTGVWQQGAVSIVTVFLFTTGYYFLKTSFQNDYPFVLKCSMTLVLSITAPMIILLAATDSSIMDIINLTIQAAVSFIMFFVTIYLILKLPGYNFLQKLLRRLLLIQHQVLLIL